MIVSKIYIGVVPADKDDTVSIGVVNATNKTLVAQSFPLSRQNFDDYFKQKPDGQFTFTAREAPEFVAIKKFLQAFISRADLVQALIEVPKIVPFPFENWGLPPYSPPCTLVAEDSIYLKTAMFLTQLGYAISVFKTGAEDGRVLLHHLPEKSEYDHLLPLEPFYLSQNFSAVFAEIILGSCQSSEIAALVAAIICKNKGAYYYWSSFHSEPSSQDIVNFLRTRQRGYGHVISGSEIVRLLFRATTRKDKFERIPMEYALACKKYEFLEEHYAQKAAVLHVCKLWEIGLQCTSRRQDAKDNSRARVFPLMPDDEWIIAALEGKSEKNSNWME